MTVAYVTGLGENQVVENYIIKVISPKNYADYFINEDNVKKELTAEGTKFSFSEDMTIKMPFKIASEGFYTNLNVVGDNHGFEKLTVYLEDFYDKNNAIALTFTDYNENLCNLSVNFSGNRISPCAARCRTKIKNCRFIIPTAPSATKEAIS